MTKKFSRREFIKLGGLIAAGAGLAPMYGEVFAQGLKRLARGQTRVIWVQGQSCSGCSVSLLNADHPYILEVITDIISLSFHQTVSAAQGQVAMQALKDGATGDYVLVVEGSIPLGMPEACLIAGRPFADLLLPLVRKARYIVGAGTCATYGGMPAAEGNQTGAASLMEFMQKNGIDPKGLLVNCPSCPVHPDAIVGTIAYLAARGYPQVDKTLLTPKMYFSRSTHDDCPRYHYYAKHIFAKHFGDTEGCLFKLGCLGMLSYTECPRRQWNSGVNWCVRAGAPCIGCSHPQFGKKRSFPFYRKGEEHHKVQYGEADRKGGAR